ncbi:MAG: rplU [Phenylobacterium sp.]|nr:rplU [Phenylobacterium sp.]
MYAVIKTGGKQYRVSPGDLMVVEKLAGEPGANVAFGEVLMIGEGEAVTVGAPTVAGASVSATLIETRRGEKVKIFKKIRRQGYRRTKGHRQTETVLRVTAIAGADGKQIKWDGKVDLTTKGELNARARGLTYISPSAQAEAAAAAKVQTPKATTAKVAKPAPKAAAKARKIETADEVVADPEVIAAMNTAETNAPVATEAPSTKAGEAPAKKAAAPKADAKPAAEKKAAPAKAAAPEKKAAAPKKAAAAPKKDKSAK